MNLELMKAGYPPIDIKFTDRIAYYNAFDEYHVEHNLDVRMEIENAKDINLLCGIDVTSRNRNLKKAGIKDSGILILFRNIPESFFLLF